jgi:hypothetical protein
MGAYPSGAIGRARVDPRNPVSFAICDRCGLRYNRTDLSWQFGWRGDKLQNLRILVCDRCNDIPNEQLRSYSPPADPLPVINPRPELAIEGNYPIVITTVAHSSQPLIAADPLRTIVQFALPPSFGLFINATGGTAGPGQSGSEFYAPGSAYQAFTTAAQPAINYYSNVAGLTIVVETQDGGVPI